MIKLSKKTFLLIGICLIACQQILLAQASFTATISPATIGKNETAELRLMVDNAQQVEQIIPPSLKDFIILSGPNQESGMESTNGVTRQYIGITFTVKPRKTGKFIIQPAIAKADGKTLRSNTVSLLVDNSTGNGQQGNSAPGGLSGFYEPVMPSVYKDYILKKGENIADKVSKNIFIKVDVNKNTCFVGEPVVVVYKLYTRLKSESSIIKNPSFNGFSVIDLLAPGSTYYSVETINGKEYNVYTLRKSQLYPLQAGVVELETAEVENNIHFIKEEFVNRQRDALDNMLRDFAQTNIPSEGLQDEKVTLQSKPVFITVKPLPEKDQPTTFKGSVGNFTIDAALEKNNFTTDDAGKLNIAITGEGNMPMIIAPEIGWPAGIEPYEAHTKEQLDQLTVPVSGIKVFEYPFTVAKGGTYTIPEIAFSFFDVKSGKYKTVKTTSFSITVAKGTGKKQPNLNGEIIKTGKEYFFDTIFTNRWLIVIPLAILILAGLFVLFQTDKKNHKPTIPFVVKNDEPIAQPVIEPGTVLISNDISINPLLLAERKLISQDSRSFYEELNNEMRKFLADKFQMPLSTLNKKSIAEEADRRGVAVSTSLQIQQLLDDIEWQLYTPFAEENKMEEIFSAADAVVHALNATTR
jgi:hypothetical protein